MKKSNNTTNNSNENILNNQNSMSDFEYQKYIALLIERQTNNLVFLNNTRN